MRGAYFGVVVNIGKSYQAGSVAVGSDRSRADSVMMATVKLYHPCLTQTEKSKVANA